jgi:hypothetical protein
MESPGKIPELDSAIPISMAIAPAPNFLQMGKRLSSHKEAITENASIKRIAAVFVIMLCRTRYCKEIN